MLHPQRGLRMYTHRPVTGKRCSLFLAGACLRLRSRPELLLLVLVLNAWRRPHQASGCRDSSESLRMPVEATTDERLGHSTCTDLYPFKKWNGLLNCFIDSCLSMDFRTFSPCTDSVFEVQLLGFMDSYAVFSIFDRCFAADASTRCCWNSLSYRNDDDSWCFQTTARKITNSYMLIKCTRLHTLPFLTFGMHESRILAVFNVSVTMQLVGASVLAAGVMTNKKLDVVRWRLVPEPLPKIHRTFHV